MEAVRLSHKIRLEATPHQESHLRRACGVSRFTWNWALAEWRRQYDLGGKPSGLELKKQFNAIKPIEFPWMYEVTKYASQQPFLHLQAAFQRFFRKEARYPRFKRRGVHDSFYIGNDHIQVEDKRIRIPKLGWVKMREVLRFSGRVVSATVSRVADKWFVSLTVELDEAPKPCESQEGIGVDLGINRLASLSNGETFEGPKPLKRYLSKVRRLSRRLSRKKKGSKNRAKARIRLARLHYRIRCLRQDALHKLTSHLTDNYDEIVVEDLNVKGMLQNRRLARTISDMGFHEFRRQLGYKAELRGNHLVMVDRWFPSSRKCSRCHVVKEELTLGERVFRCDACRLEMDRDKNAALNLMSTVSFTGFEACGEEGSGSSHGLSETGLREAGTGV